MGAQPVTGGRVEGEGRKGGVVSIFLEADPTEDTTLFSVE